MKFETYHRIRNRVEQYNPSVTTYLNDDTLIMDSINLKMFIHNYSNDISFKTIKNNCFIKGHARFFDLKDTPVTTDSEKFANFEKKLSNAIAIAKCELLPLETFKISKIKGRKYVSPYGTHKIILNNQATIEFSRVLVVKEEVILDTHGIFYAVFKGMDAKKILSECSKFKEIEITVRDYR